jgi:hypothetical protein
LGALPLMRAGGSVILAASIERCVGTRGFTTEEIAAAALLLASDDSS